MALRTVPDMFEVAFSFAGEQPVRKVEAERAEVDDRSRARMKDQRPRLIVLLHDWNNCIDRGRLRTYGEDSAAQVRKKSGRDHPGSAPTCSSVHSQRWMPPALEEETRCVR